MKKFILNIIAIVSPIVLLLTFYIATDPFRIIYHYDPYYTESVRIWPNRSHGSTMTYINQQPHYHYDSFIFGNSRSLYYQIDEWKKYLPKGSRCMHFDDSGGSVRGLCEKIIFIDKTGGKLNNVLLVLDYELLERFDLTDSHLFLSSPILRDNENFWQFHKDHFLAFLNYDFIKAYIDYSLFKTYRPYMSGTIMDRPLTYLPEYNEIQEKAAEEAIEQGIFYDEEKIKTFVGRQRPKLLSPGSISKESLAYLKEIKHIFDKHHTSYKIVISPLYDQVRMNKDTAEKIATIFGKEHIFDFAGVNKWTIDYHNYYEVIHYRPLVAAEILDSIY